MGPADQAPFRNSFDDLTLHLYNITRSVTFDLYDAGKTVTISAERQTDEIVLTTSEPVTDMKTVLSEMASPGTSIEASTTTTRLALA